MGQPSTAAGKSTAEPKRLSRGTRIIGRPHRRAVGMAPNLRIQSGRTTGHVSAVLSASSGEIERKIARKKAQKRWVQFRVENTKSGPTVTCTLAAVYFCKSGGTLTYLI